MPLERYVHNGHMGIPQLEKAVLTAHLYDLIATVLTLTGCVPCREFSTHVQLSVALMHCKAPTKGRELAFLDQRFAPKKYSHGVFPKIGVPPNHPF